MTMEFSKVRRKDVSVSLMTCSPCFPSLERIHRLAWKCDKKILNTHNSGKMSGLYLCKILVASCDRRSAEKSSTASPDMTGEKIGLVTGQDVAEASAALRLRSKAARDFERAGSCHHRWETS